LERSLETARGGTSVADIAACVALSHRRFIQLFTAEVAMTPKLFARVRRFQRAVALAKQGPSPDWGHLALACGYFDQSHLVRDFVTFSGLSPTEFARHRGERVKENKSRLKIPMAIPSSSTRRRPAPK